MKIPKSPNSTSKFFNNSPLSAAVILTHHEIEMLREEQLPHEAKILYMLYIRPYMDYGTGIVGVRRKISYQMFQEHLSITRPRGSRTPQFNPTIQNIRTLINYLIDYGLLIKIPNKARTAPMVFNLPLALTNFSRANEQQQMSNNPSPTPPTPAAPGAEEVEGNTGESQDEQHAPEIPASSPSLKDKPVGFPIPPDWQPSETVYHILSLDKIPAEFIEKCVPEFIHYWSTLNVPRPSWDNTYISNVQTKFKYDQAQQYSKPTSHKPSDNSNTSNSVWNDTGWAENYTGGAF